MDVFLNYQVVGKAYISLVLEELKAAKTNKLNLTAAWSDVANAYGFIPHHFGQIFV